MDRALDYARRITANGPFAVRKTKESVLTGLAVDMNEAYRIESALSSEVFSSETRLRAHGLRRETPARVEESLVPASPPVQLSAQARHHQGETWPTRSKTRSPEHEY